MATGVVKWFSPEKGFGFIRPDDEGDDVFVHVRTLSRTGLIDLKEGQVVHYEMEAGRNGRMAAGRVTLG